MNADFTTCQSNGNKDHRTAITELDKWELLAVMELQPKIHNSKKNVAIVILVLTPITVNSKDKL